MIQLFHGDDTFESYTAAKKEVEKISKESSYPVKILNLDEFKDISSFRLEFEGVGMFSEQSIIFGKRLSKSKILVDFFVEHTDTLLPYDMIIWEESALKKNTKLYKVFSKKGKVNSFTELKPWQMEKWISTVAKARKISLSREQIQVLIERYETDKWLLHQEIYKISLYLKSKDTKTITLNELKTLSNKTASGDIWEFLDAFGNKKRKIMFDHYFKLMHFDDKSQYLIAMLQRELMLMFKLIYATKNNIDFKTIKIHPYVLKKTKGKASNFSLSEIKKLYSNLLRTDLSIKSGELHPESAMLHFLSTL